jgi:hypothetical protein
MSYIVRFLDIKSINSKSQIKRQKQRARLNHIAFAFIIPCSKRAQFSTLVSMWPDNSYKMEENLVLIHSIYRQGTSAIHAAYTWVWGPRLGELP